MKTAGENNGKKDLERKRGLGREAILVYKMEMSERKTFHNLGDIDRY